MKKTLIIAMIFIFGSIGFLVYDWHVKTKIYEDDQRVTLYSWTDEKGARHYTNTQPPDGARDVQENKGFEYTDQPLALKLKRLDLSSKSKADKLISLARIPVVSRLMSCTMPMVLMRMKVVSEIR